MLWKNSKMDTVYWGSEAAEESDPCEVKIDGKLIVVSYDEDDGPNLYRGEDLGGGHFSLKKADGHGQATLHQFVGGEILEGYWEEGGYRGFWRIKLG